MTLPSSARLALYVVMSVLPTWQDFFTKSTDYSLRGLAMPIIASLMGAATVILARTRSQDSEPPTAP